MKNYCLSIFLGVATILYSCKKEQKSEAKNLYNSEGTAGSIGSTYHTDSDYKYEYRTGTTGNYEYNYDVTGEDADGNEISGNVDMNGKYGSGYITDDNGNEKEVEVEWVDYGRMEATDEDGNTYEMEAE